MILVHSSPAIVHSYYPGIYDRAFINFLPLTFNKYHVQITSGSLSWRAINSVLVELLVLHFILIEELTTAPLPRVIRSNLSPTIFLDLVQGMNVPMYSKDNYICLKVYFWCLVPLRYLSTLISLAQSPSLGSCTLVVRNDTAIWMSRRALLAANNIWYVVRWNALASSLLSFFPFSWILYKWSAALVLRTFPKSLVGIPFYLWYKLTHVDLHFVVKRVIKSHPKIVVYHPNSLCKILSIYIFYLLHKRHDVVLIGVAYHEIISMPSDSHLSAMYCLVHNAGIVWVDFKTHIT